MLNQNKTRTATTKTMAKNMGRARMAIACALSAALATGVSGVGVALAATTDAEPGACPQAATIVEDDYAGECALESQGGDWSRGGTFGIPRGGR